MNSWTSPVDIRPDHLAIVQEILRVHLPAGFKVWVFGSRANWTTKDASDLDLAVEGPAKLGHKEMIRLEVAFEESDLPYTVDVVDLKAVSSNFRQIVEDQRLSLPLHDQAGKDEWETASWGDLATLEYGKSLRGYESSEGPYRVYGTNGPIGWCNEPLCFHSSVIIGRKGAYRGVHYSATPFFVIDTAFYLRPKVEIHTRWAYYQLLTQDINGMDSGSAIPSTSREDFYGLPVKVPPLAEQRAIAHVLGTLDDKIELNRRMNRTLEEMARAIFQDWFVDFGPTRAKMEGQDPYLPPELWNLFPDELVGSELGGIPEGWEIKKLPELVDYKEGPGIRHWQYTNSNEGTRFINIRCIQDDDLLLETANRITDNEANGKYAHFHLKEFDIVVSTSGTLGRSAVVRPSHLPLVLNTSVIRFRPIKGVTTFSYLYGYIKSAAFMDELEMSASGSVQKNFGPMHLKVMPMLCPPHSIIQRFEQLASPLLLQMVTKRAESDVILTQKKSILPKLLAGELSVANLGLPDFR